MSIRIVFFAAAVFTCQATPQLSIVRPFATGFSNGFSEMAKPFFQVSQPVVSPPSDFFAAVRPRPQLPQWVSYPGQPANVVPQGQVSPAFEGFDAIPGTFVQLLRPRPLRPYFPPPPPPPSQAVPIPSSRPYPIPMPIPAPAPAPAPSSSSSSSSSEEDSEETYVPSSLLVEQPEAPVNAPEPAVEAEPEISSLQRPLPAVEEEQ